jgi:nifR3 family TIM-barrel protein
MANVTDVAFRAMIATYGKPDVMWNEFVSADGLCSSGKDKLLLDLRFSKKERPIVAQLFTGHPEAMRKAAQICAELGYDGVDINMGCPDRAVEKQGGGAASMKDPKNALGVLNAARECSIPVSVKTRIGYNKVDMNWLKLLLEQKLPALTIHLRTRKEMSDVPAHWELMPEIVKLRDEVQKDIPAEERTLLIGNGDVESVSDGATKVKKYGCDGVMIGRGIFGTPWLFEAVAEIRSTKSETNPKFKNLNPKTKTPSERLKIMLEHAKLYEKKFGGIKNFAVMKKHFKAYVSGWDGAKELRVKLMETENARQVDKIVKEYLKK